MLLVFHIEVKVTDYNTLYGIIYVVRTTPKNTGFGSFAVGFVSKKENTSGLKFKNTFS